MKRTCNFQIFILIFTIKTIVQKLQRCISVWDKTNHDMLFAEGKLITSFDQVCIVIDVTINRKSYRRLGCMEHQIRICFCTNSRNQCAHCRTIFYCKISNLLKRTRKLKINIQTGMGPVCIVIHCTLFKLLLLTILIIKITFYI